MALYDIGYCWSGAYPCRTSGKMLYAEKIQDPVTKIWEATGIVREYNGGPVVEPAYWLGKYSDMPHILSFLNESYQTFFEVLNTDYLAFCHYNGKLHQGIRRRRWVEYQALFRF